MLHMLAVPALAGWCYTTLIIFVRLLMIKVGKLQCEKNSIFCTWRKFNESPMNLRLFVACESEIRSMKRYHV